MSTGKELDDLRAYKKDAWDAAYPGFYRIAYAGCHLSLNADKEEIASQAVHELLNYLDKVDSLDELKTAGHNILHRFVR